MDLKKCTEVAKSIDWSNISPDNVLPLHIVRHHWVILHRLWFLLRLALERNLSMHISHILSYIAIDFSLGETFVRLYYHMFYKVKRDAPSVSCVTPATTKLNGF